MTLVGWKWVGSKDLRIGGDFQGIALWSVGRVGVGWRGDEIGMVVRGIRGWESEQVVRADGAWLSLI